MKKLNNGAIYVYSTNFISCITLRFLIKRIYNDDGEQEAQLMLTNLCEAFIGQSRSPNIALFHMLGIVSYCAIVTLSLRRAVFTILDLKKCRV